MKGNGWEGIFDGGDGSRYRGGGNGELVKRWWGSVVRLQEQWVRGRVRGRG